MIDTHGSNIFDEMHVHRHDTISTEEAIDILNKYADARMLENHHELHGNLDADGPAFLQNKGWLALAGWPDSRHVHCLYNHNGHYYHCVITNDELLKESRRQASVYGWQCRLVQWCAEHENELLGLRRRAG